MVVSITANTQSISLALLPSHRTVTQEQELLAGGAEASVVARRTGVLNETISRKRPDVAQSEVYASLVLQGKHCG